MWRTVTRDVVRRPLARIDQLIVLLVRVGFVPSHYATCKSHHNEWHHCPQTIRALEATIWLWAWRMLMARLAEEEDPYLKGVRAGTCRVGANCSLPFAKITQIGADVIISQADWDMYSIWAVDVTKGHESTTCTGNNFALILWNSKLKIDSWKGSRI